MTLRNLLEVQHSQMFSCAEGSLRKLLSRQALAILQSQTLLQCHLLIGLPLHVICVIHAPGTEATSGRGVVTQW